MAAFTILNQEVVGDTRRVEVLAYTSIGTGSNSAGIPWRDVVTGFVTYRNRRNGTGTQSTVPVPATVQDQLDAGELFEWRHTAVFPANFNNAQALAAIQSAVDAREVERTAELMVELAFFGHTTLT